VRRAAPLWIIAIAAPASYFDPVPPSDADLERFAQEVQAALGARLTSAVLYGSAASGEWIAGKSDINVALVLTAVDAAALDALAPVVARWRKRGFALPLVVDADYLRRACAAFPMEIEDLRRRHRVLAGSDPFAALQVDDATLRRELEQEAAGKLLRLRAFYLENAGAPAALEGLLRESAKTFLVLLRHLLHLRGIDEPHCYEDVLAAGEKELGPLPAMRRAFALRGSGVESAAALPELARAYLAEVERLVDATRT